MVELCVTERIIWTTLVSLTAVMATIPRLEVLSKHGKVLDSTRRSVGPAGWFEITVPKRWFSHFYFLGLVSASIILVDMFSFGGALIIEQLQSRSVCSKIAARDPHVWELGAESLACIVLSMVHMCRRFWECKAITQWGSSRMSWAGYLVGLVHYQLLVVTIVVEGPRLTSFGVGTGLGRDSLHLFEAMELRHILALGLFVVATARQHEAIRHLASLKVTASKKDSVNGKVTGETYGLPWKGWFQYVSCPHYMAEVMIYTSLWLMAGARSGTVGQGYQLVLTWVFANQAFLAAKAHTWYQLRFPDYPRGRRRLIPGIW